METRTRINGYVFITLLCLLTVLSAGIALITYRYYGVIVRGILGAIFLYVFIFSEGPRKNDISFKTALSDPKKGKYFLYALIYPMVAAWAALEIFEMIMYLRK